MKNLIIALSLLSAITAKAGQVKSDCSAISENRAKIVKVNSENTSTAKKSALVQ